MSKKLTKANEIASITTLSARLFSRVLELNALGSVG